MHRWMMWPQQIDVAAQKNFDQKQGENNCFHTKETKTVAQPQIPAGWSKQQQNSRNLYIVAF